MREALRGEDVRSGDAPLEACAVFVVVGLVDAVVGTVVVMVVAVVDGDNGDGDAARVAARAFRVAVTVADLDAAVAAAGLFLVAEGGAGMPIPKDGEAAVTCIGVLGAAAADGPSPIGISGGPALPSMVACVPLLISRIGGEGGDA
mmetsp:Transcript_10172/g.18344  ORF Transcript_10172/g.18344 Transcript_10172/m.18344 type:complete len:146 (-) Transcript_10172:53-490(-)|eukprot:CAMPEP_0201936624 /NCGR_PEP_ID=MMETSP0903-20130614/37819_1 /ASSEMBLY_ACC=CAM_ASM_000552 /TAXON_ID=420261 /ORGANISM="Thalassiosira antarctica, Strain CCMP982" /LENGTH=145 /DNA_ID=CAMNT_0048477349 /DNA_START=190 /DNA_END=627 /DNA_ORIENTATION=+